MPAFDRSFTPPVPVASVVVAHPVMVNNVLNRFIITLDGRNLRFDLRPA